MSFIRPGRAVRSALAWIVSASLIVPTLPAHAGPMDVGGQFTVTEAGGASYTLPLQVPPGTGGIEPKLALTYNSQTGNGLLGVGWSLSGLSAITRCGRTIAQDGVKGGVNFDGNDRFCMDGQRLMVVSGTYGADGAEYRTERDSFSKVISYGAAGNGPAWFKVWTKAGQILEYGNTADSRIEAQGKSSARVWAINKISDTKSNYLTFSYTEDTVNGDYYPTRIDYTGNSSTGLATNSSVQFVYEARPDIVPMYFQGSLIKSTQRLKTIQAYAGAAETKEYRLAYGTGNSARSRITSISECNTTTCKPALTPTWTDQPIGFNTGSSWTGQVTSFLADVNGDGKADMIAQQSDGIYVALSTGTGVGTNTQWINSFGYNQGYSDQNVTPIFLMDVNADGLADVVGIASDGVYVALSNGSSFGTPSKWSNDFGSSSTSGSWTNVTTYPRTFADMNGDGLPDIVGFKNDGVYVALNAGGVFTAATKWLSDFGTATSVAYASGTANPRFVQDMNGDGLPDIVGFANTGVYVAINTGASPLNTATPWLSDFGVNAGYTTQDTYPRTLADVNGDGLPDVVGFKTDGTYLAINIGTGLQTASRVLTDFGTTTATAYSSQKGFPRYVADVNGDGKADIVGFAAAGVQVALSNGTSFNASSQWVAGFGSNAGYSTSTLRQLGDVDGDGIPDIVGTTTSGASVGRSAKAVMPDMVATLANGLGATTTISYTPLTNSGFYTRGSGASYPQADITAPLYVVSITKTPNALGSGYTTQDYGYGGLRVDMSGRGLLGFKWTQVTQDDTGITVRTDYSQDWPYNGLPMQVMKSLPGYGNSGVLSLVTNSYSCINPANGATCVIGTGNRYFPYQAQSIESTWDGNGAALPIVMTKNVFDSYGNATQVTVSTSDGFTKTTSNTYTNDTTNWLLGRLSRSQVASTSGTVDSTLASSTPEVALGGTITEDATYRYHTFTSSGTFNVLSGSKTVEAFVVGGGGGGGAGVDFAGGGGGAGGYVYSSLTLGVGNYNVVVGSGGARGTSYSSGSSGGASSFNSSFVANGGAGGARGGTGSTGNNGGYGAGGAGGTASGGTTNTIGAKGSNGASNREGYGGAGGAESGPYGGTGGTSGPPGTSQGGAGNNYGAGGGGGGGWNGGSLYGGTGAPGVVVVRYPKLSNQSLSSSAFVFNQTISANTTNYNLRVAAVNAGWKENTPLQASITVASGVAVGSTTTSAYAFDTGAGFPTGSSLTLVNSGSIVGMGGAGGGAGSGAGAAGGPALRAQAAIAITNNGTIGGGGGGGGGGAGGSGAGGGGGRGFNGGAGGGGGSTGYCDNYGGCYYSPTPGGDAGSLTAPGGGGNGADYGGGNGGGGGQFGSAGGGGGGIGQFDPYGNYVGYIDGGAGGAAGAAVVGNAKITWTATGTRLGAIQ